MTTPLHFDDDYREEAKLADGTVAVLRAIQPGDKDLLREGFDQLSPRSRQMRFFAGKKQLSQEELRALTEIDGWNHFALGAASPAVDGQPQRGLGVARFARDHTRPEVAEAAITVVDAFQGKGLGTLLLERLSAAARERGVRRFFCEFLAHNQGVWKLMEQVGTGAQWEREGQIIRAEIPIPDTHPESRPWLGDRTDLVYDLLRHSARGALRLRLGRLLLKHR